MRALIFDLDGTLVDTVYGHVLAWQRALAEAGLAIDGWRIKRRKPSSGGMVSCFVIFCRRVGRFRVPSSCSGICARSAFRTVSPPPAGVRTLSLSGRSRVAEGQRGHRARARGTSEARA